MRVRVQNKRAAFIRYNFIVTFRREITCLVGI